MYLPLEELEAIMEQANETSYEAAVKAYIDNHPRRIDYWVTGELDR
jgi:glycine betaine/proline transport system substrate-binding protein